MHWTVTFFIYEMNYVLLFLKLIFGLSFTNLISNTNNVKLQLLSLSDVKEAIKKASESLKLEKLKRSREKERQTAASNFIKT